MTTESDELLECRAFNHAWESTSMRRSKTTLVDALHLVCIRCGSEKDQGIGRYGYLDSTTYRLSPIYVVVKDKYDRAEARAELYKRQKKALKVTRHLEVV